MSLSLFPLASLHTQKGMSLFIAQLMSIVVLIATVFGIIWEISRGRISLKSEILLLVLNFVSGSRLKLMYISFFVNFRSRNHLHQQNLLQQSWTSDRLVISAKGFLKVPNLLVLIKQKRLSLPKNLATFSELLIVFSTKVNLRDLR